MLAYIPDVISRTLFGTIWVFVYYLLLLYFSLIAMTYTMTAAVESLLQELPQKAKRFRFLFFVLYGVSGYVLNVIYIGADMLSQRSYLLPFLMAIAILCNLVLILTISFLYPIKKLYEDYHFIYGQRPLAFFKASWRICPLVLLVSVTYLYLLL